MLFPSKKMQNWFKFAWNPGDILVNKDGNVHIIFEGFDDYTGCIQCFTSKVYKTLGGIYKSYRFAKLKYLTVVEN